MDASVWSDYICPWCYAGLARTATLRDLGLTVTVRPFELHPEFSEAGVTLRPSRRWDAIADVCEQSGVPFVPPPRLPNSRRLLEAGEVLRSAGVQAAFHDSMLTAAFGEGQDLGDPAVVDAVLAGVGAVPEDVWEAVDRGDGRQPVAASKAAALDAGIGGTPAWLIGGEAVIGGVQRPEVFARVVDRLRARGAPRDAG